jgi:hypothetical protein
MSPSRNLEQAQDGPNLLDVLEAGHDVLRCPLFADDVFVGPVLVGFRGLVLWLVGLQVVAGPWIVVGLHLVPRLHGGEARRPASAKATAVRRSFSEGGSTSGAKAAASNVAFSGHQVDRSYGILTSKLS